MDFYVLEYKVSQNPSSDYIIDDRNIHVLRIYNLTKSFARLYWIRLHKKYRLTTRSIAKNIKKIMNYCI